MFSIEKDGLLVELCSPGEYYRGTRFDHACVFRRIVKDGYVFADEWFTGSDPLTHDHVCGLSEEFVTVDFDGVAPGTLFCKPGVGLLRRPDDAPYDWFHLYEIVVPGEWKVEAGPESVRYEHRLEGFYRYVKEISLQDGGRLEISHRLEWEADRPLEGFFYNHNFLTFGGAPVGPSRSIRFPWRPAGHWRSVYDNVGFSRNAIEFTDLIAPGGSVYCGDVHNADGETSCEFSVVEGEYKVEVLGDRPLDHLVFWSNPRVACPEPYVPLSVGKGESASWRFSYRFSRG